MVPALLAESGVVSAHHPLGASTGYMEDRRGGSTAMVGEALETSGFAVELAALSEEELPGLEAFLATRPELPFAYLSIHAPVKHLLMPEAELVRRLARLAPGGGAAARRGGFWAAACRIADPPGGTSRPAPVRPPRLRPGAGEHGRAKAD